MIEYEGHTDIMIPEDVYDEICMIMDCDFINFMGIS